MRDVGLIEERKAQPPPRVTGPRAGTGFGGDPTTVAWDRQQHAELTPWFKIEGGDTKQKITGRLVHDGEFLYIRLDHLCDTDKLKANPDVWSGDDWEIYVGAKRTTPFRQIGVNPDGKSVAIHWTSDKDGYWQQNDWTSNAKIVSDVKEDAWRVSISIPLAELIPGGAKPGDTVHVNFYRGGFLLAWSPTFENTFQRLNRLGAMTLER